MHIGGITNGSHKLFLNNCLHPWPFSLVDALLSLLKLLFTKGDDLDAVSAQFLKILSFSFFTSIPGRGNYLLGRCLDPVSMLLAEGLPPVFVRDPESSIE